MNRIDQELSTQKRKIWIQNIQESKFSIGLIISVIVVLLWNIYKSSDELVNTSKIYGTLIGVHQVQTNLGSTVTMLSIELKNGGTVMVTAPETFVVKNNAEVELLKGLSKQGSEYYYFSGYR